MKKSWLSMAALALIVAGCSSSEENTPQELADTPITVNASVNPLSTRAGYSSSELPASFNLKITNSQNSSYSYDVTMKPAVGDVPWLAYDAEGNTKLMLWMDNETTVDVKASTFRISDDAVTLEAEADQTDAANVKKSDHLMWNNTAQKPSGEGISVELNHVMTKVNITVTLGDQYDGTPNPITAVTICGTKASASFHRTNGWTVDATAAAAEIKAFDLKDFTAVGGDVKNAIAKYEVILVPQTVAKGQFSVKLAIAGETYTWTSDEDVVMNQGECHELKLVAGKDKVVGFGFTPMDWAETSSKITTD